MPAARPSRLVSVCDAALRGGVYMYMYMYMHMYMSLYMYMYMLLLLLLYMCVHAWLPSERTSALLYVCPISGPHGRCTSSPLPPPQRHGRRLP